MCSIPWLRFRSSQPSQKGWAEDLFVTEPSDNFDFVGDLSTSAEGKLFSLESVPDPLLFTYDVRQKSDGFLSKSAIRIRNFCSLLKIPDPRRVWVYKPQKDTWSYAANDVFARSLATTSSWTIPSEHLVSDAKEQRCAICSPLLVESWKSLLANNLQPHPTVAPFLGSSPIRPPITLSLLHTTADDCQLCTLLLHTAQQYIQGGTRKEFRIHKEWVFLRIRDGARLLRLCSGPSGGLNKSGIPIGLPAVSQPGSPMYFELLRAWLRRCDKSHNCYKRSLGTDEFLPTRLLYVGNPNPDILVLRLSTQLNREPYIALSHCWGNISIEDKQKFCTISQNIHDRLESFNFDELPQTFQDAIRVTRELGLKYLWIDSLCIIQDDIEDWKCESALMEGIFSMAYCTIAATSATSSYEGFLTRNPNGQYIEVNDAFGRAVYVSDDIEDFENDVEKALLNTRAWVLQERILSCRTIHFSKHYVYWECGDGVYCEDLTMLESPARKQYFLLDPRFPDRLSQSGNHRTVYFIQSLFEDYSKRGLTRKTDRAVAISGLERRIATSLNSKKRYGIFERFLHRNLLWQRSGIAKMQRIDYGDQKVPSWSWMAFDGGIQFINFPFENAEWTKDLRFDSTREDAIVAELGQFQSCHVKREGLRCIIYSLNKQRVGWLRYDADIETDTCLQRCVVVGRNRTANRPALPQLPESRHAYYILVVRSTISQGEYERIGAGIVFAEYVSRAGISVQII